MASVRLARQTASRSDQVWEAQADPEKNQVVIRHGKRGSTLRMKVVPKSCFTEFNAEMELEYRATKKRAEGFVDEIDSEETPGPAAPQAESLWPTLYSTATKAYKQRAKSTFPLEREVAHQVMLAFDLEIPPEWLDRPRVIESSNDYALPMLLYALGACRNRAVDLANDDGDVIQPIPFVERYALADLDSRVPVLLSEIGLISAHKAMAAVEPQTADTEESDWFF